ncbi:MAG: DUF2062 domain-containing protein [Planctomycetota bacterium]|nr:DUF2062 domain-containing protein [Planctomycetota bacterium]
MARRKRSLVERGRRRMLSLLYRIIRLDDAPRSIALGGSIGLFISMTPTYGFQMMLVLFTNTIFRCNRLAGIVAVHFTNPVTALPLYWLDYRLGVHLLGQSGIGREEFARVLSKISSAPFIDALHQLVTLGWGIFGPIALGGIILGAILGAGSYVPLLYGIKRFKETRALRRARRKLKRRQDRREKTAGPAGGPEEIESSGHPRRLFPDTEANGNGHGFGESPEEGRAPGEGLADGGTGGRRKGASDE